MSARILPFEPIDTLARSIAQVTRSHRLALGRATTEDEISRVTRIALFELEAIKREHMKCATV